MLLTSTTVSSASLSCLTWKNYTWPAIPVKIGQVAKTILSLMCPHWRLITGKWLFHLKKSKPSNFCPLSMHHSIKPLKKENSSWRKKNTTTNREWKPNKTWLKKKRPNLKRPIPNNLENKCTINWRKTRTKNKEIATPKNINSKSRAKCFWKTDR